MLGLGRRSVILVDNRCPLMCGFRGKRWMKYIIIIILENSSVQGSRGSTWNKYISMSYTKSYLRMPCSIYWNTRSFTIFDYIIWYGYKTTYITKVDRSHNIQWWVFNIWKLCKVKHNTLLRNLGYRCEPKVFVKIQRKRYNPGHVNRCVEVEHGKDSTDCQ